MTLAETLAPQRPPIQQDEDGIMRIGGTRVTLDTIVYAYDNGASAEEIAMAYDAVSLAHVHAVISYYLQNRPQILEYLEQGKRAQEEVRRQFPPRETWQVVRQRLLARRQA
jgi:uncharacterized protein (DUF433 family)